MSINPELATLPGEDLHDMINRRVAYLRMFAASGCPNLAKLYARRLWNYAIILMAREQEQPPNEPICS